MRSLHRVFWGLGLWGFQVGQTCNQRGGEGLYLVNHVWGGSRVMWRIRNVFSYVRELCLGSKVSLMLEKCHLSYSLLWFKSSYNRRPTVPNVVLCRRNIYIFFISKNWMEKLIFISVELVERVPTAKVNIHKQVFFISPGQYNLITNGICAYMQKIPIQKMLNCNLVVLA